MEPLQILRRVAALAIFVGIVFVFRRSARAHGRKPWHWSSLGVLAFYGTYFAVAVGSVALFVGIAALTDGQLSTGERQVVPLLVRAAIVAGVVLAFLVTNRLLRRLEAAASPNSATTASLTTAADRAKLSSS